MKDEYKKLRENIGKFSSDFFENKNENIYRKQLIIELNKILDEEQEVYEQIDEMNKKDIFAKMSLLYKLQDLKEILRKG